MKMLVGIAVLGMLAVVGCGGTVVVTATPTAVVVVLPTPTATPVPIATPDIRAALREECNLVIAAFLKPFVTLVEQYGEQLGDQTWGSRESEEFRRLFSALPDSSIAYFYRLTDDLDLNASDDVVAVTILNRIIDDLEDGDCGSVDSEGLIGEEYRL